MASQPLFTDEEQQRGAMLGRQAVVAQVNRNVLTAENPSQARRDYRLGRDTGIPALALDEDTRPLAEVRRAQTWAEEALARAPNLIPIFANPELYGRVADDVRQLANVSNAAERSGVGRVLPGGTFGARVRAGGLYRGGMTALALSARDTLAAAGSSAGEGLAGLARSGIENLPNAVPGLSALNMPGVRETAGDPIGITARFVGDIGTYYRQARQGSQVDYGHWVPNAAARGLESVPLQIAALVAAGRGNPGGAVTILSGISGGQSYGEAREAGLGVAEATTYGAGQGGLEALGESLPVFQFAADIARGSGLFRTVGGQLWRENLGEQFTQHAQDFNRWASIDANQGRPFSEFLAERPQVILETAIATTAATGVQTTAAHTLTRAADRHVQSLVAREEARRLDRIMEAAAESVTRRESPDDFREIMAEITNDNLYVPPTAIRALFQDAPEDLSEDDFWGRYADEIAEAEAIGGDVVIPLSEAATHLAGSPQWQAIRDQVRTSPGGFSRAETDEANAEFETAIRESGEQLEQELSAERERLAPVQRVFEAMRDKLMQAGFRTDAANQLATQFAQRQATRAQRLGRELTGTEADPITVQYTLPDRLGAAIRAVDVPDAGLRAVIREMRKPRAINPRSIYGPSLIEWVRSRGGLTDRGGDLAAMGFAPMGRGVTARGAKKLIRPHDDTPGMFGSEGNENSPDVMFRAAVVAGYFPNLTEDSDLDVADFFEALDNELRGTPTYSSQNDKSDRPENQLRMAAQELSDILQQAGLSPTNASESEITRALEQYQQGRAFDQGGLFDDPTQPERTITQAQRSELEARAQQSMSRRGGQQSVKDQDGGLFSSERDQDSLFQSFSEGVRGRITFAADGSMVIDLFKQRDLSTFIHESGHLYLEELKADAQLALEMDTPEGRQLFADWETIKAWFAREGHAVGEDGTIPTEAHELFARGFERFAMEGKAPSTVLRSAFEAFRSWLLTIYKTVDRLHAPITPEVRDVMARLLATDEEIAAAAEEQNIKAAWDSAEAAGMTEPEYAAYGALTEEGREDAATALLKRAMATVRAARTKEWKEQEAGVRAEVAQIIDDQPVFKALRLLRNGRIGDEEVRKVKLDRQFIIDTYGKEALDDIPKSVPPIYGDTDIVHPDLIAEEAGFASGDEMIRTLMGHEQTRRQLREGGDKRSPRQVMIDEEVAARMAERYGDPLRDGSIEEEARALIHSDKQGEAMAFELRVLGRQTGKRPTPYALMKKWAAERVSAGIVAEVVSGAALQQYLRSARNAGKAFQEAIIKGDRDEAFRQKQKQMLNNALIFEGKKAKDEIDAAVKRLGKVARRKTMKSVDQEYLEQAQALLEDVELRDRSQASIDRQIGYEAWAAAQEAAGVDLVVPPSFAASLGKTHWSRLTVEQIMGLDATVKQIMHLGRVKQTLLDGQERRAFNEAVDELVASAGGAGKGRKVSAANDPSRHLPERIKSRVRWADAAMVKVEQMCDWLDGGKSNGPWNRLLFKPMAEAQGQESDLLRTYAEKINALIQAIPRSQAKDWDRDVDTPELINRVSPDVSQRGQPFVFGKDQIVMMALNWGNEGNRQRLLDGYKWDEGEVLQVFDRLMTAEDWAFVQGVWDALEELKPALFALERRVNGVEPDAVEASPVETRFGTFKGGYFPAVADPQYSTSAAIQEQEGKLGGRGFFKASTRASATKERSAKASRPLLLNMSVITSHMREVIHDITHREAVMQASKILADPDVRSAVNVALGPEYLNAMEGWVENIATPNIADSRTYKAIAWLGRHLHRGTSLVGLGYRVSTVLMQPLGLANLTGQIGERAVAEGLAVSAAKPLQTYREVIGRSSEMRDRFSTMDASIAEMYRDRAKEGLQRFGPGGFEKHAFDGILYADMLITTGGWIGAFNKGLRDGLTEEEATYYADKAIRTSQGAGGEKDKSAILRQSTFIRSFYPFFSYLNALYNQQRDIGRRARNIDSASDATEALRRAWWVVVVPPLLQALIFGDGPDEDDEESWAAYLARSVIVGNFASIPGVGQIVNAMGNGWGYSATSYQRGGAGVVQAGRDIGAAFDSDRDASGNWVKNALTTAGIVFAKPTGQIASTAQFGYDVATGEAEPETAGDWWRGVTSGRMETVN